jgi:RimJ/RimL family protein N-acetyltransferase
VVLCIHTANTRSMRVAAKLGFTEVEGFEEYGPEQWFGVRSLLTTPFKDPVPPGAMRALCSRG